MNKKQNLHPFIAALLLLALLVGGLSQVAADVTFSDGFEGGDFSHWAISSTSGTVTLPGAEGNYSAQFTLGESASYIQTNYPQTNSSNLQFYFLTDTTSLLPNSDVTFAMILGRQTSLCSLALWRQLDGGLVWVFFYAQNNRTIDTKIAAANIQEDTWYKLDIAVSMNNGNGGYQFSIDDQPVFSVNNIADGTWDPTIVRLGTIAGIGDNHGKIYIDSITISNSSNYTPPAPKPTTTPPPTPAAPPPPVAS
jgi:hypothetical protein